MKKIKEMVGYPGSGKSFILNKISEKNKKICTLENIIFKDFLNKKILSKIYLFYISLFLKKNTINYIKTKVLNHYKNWFNRNIFYDLNTELKIQNSVFLKKHAKLNRIFSSLVKDTIHSDLEKKKIIKNFNTYGSSYSYYLKHKNIDKIVINDEEFYQKIFLNYNKKKKNKIIKNIKIYLNNIPRDIEIINISTSIEKSIYQCEKRARYFSYKKNSMFLKNFFPEINKIIRNYCKRKKIKYYKLSSEYQKIYLK